MIEFILFLTDRSSIIKKMRKTTLIQDRSIVINLDYITIWRNLRLLSDNFNWK